jgi:hypothetical protein
MDRLQSLDRGEDRQLVARHKSTRPHFNNQRNWHNIDSERKSFHLPFKDCYPTFDGDFPLQQKMEACKVAGKNGGSD